MTGDHATDMSDASGTLWLNVRERCWDDSALDATGIDTRYMPQLHEGSDITGVLRAQCASEWNLPRVPVAAGGGDQAAGAVGVGAVKPSVSTLALGTSGVVFVPDFEYRATPERGVHSFCHALPDVWHQMGVVLSAAGSLEWIASTTGHQSVEELIRVIEHDAPDTDAPLFLPYLGGERTPHNDPLAMGVFVGLTLNSSGASIGRAVLEGVAMALRDCCDALSQGGTAIDNLNVVGGGTKSLYWSRMLADVLESTITIREGAAVGPALGAARLAQLGLEGLAVDEVCALPPVRHVIEPREVTFDYYRERFALYRRVYQDLKPRFGDFHRVAEIRRKTMGVGT